MKAADLKRGDVVRYKGTTSYYMDMTVISADETLVNLHRPYIILNEDGYADLKSELCVFSRTSNMEFVFANGRR